MGENKAVYFGKEVAKMFGMNERKLSTIAKYALKLRMEFGTWRFTKNDVNKLKNLIQEVDGKADVT